MEMLINFFKKIFGIESLEKRIRILERKNYPKCVPIAKARAMSKGQRAGAVKRKQAKANTGPTPSRAATFAPKRKKMSMGGLV